MTQQTNKMKPTRSVRHAQKAPQPKRVRLSPLQLPRAADTGAVSPTPTLPPLHSIVAGNHVAQTNNETQSSSNTASAPPATKRSATARKLLELRATYLEDIGMVEQELRNVLAHCPGSTAPGSPFSPAVVLKLVRTIETLGKLRALLCTNPKRLRATCYAQLCAVEQQVQAHLLPLATILRSFSCSNNAGKDKDCFGSEPSSENTSPRSPSGTTAQQHQQQHQHQHQELRSPSLPAYDWRYLSMALCLHL